MQNAETGYVRSVMLPDRANGLRHIKNNTVKGQGVGARIILIRELNKVGALIFLTRIGIRRARRFNGLLGTGS
jgi:hypothetical protein